MTRLLTIAAAWLAGVMVAVALVDTSDWQLSVCRVLAASGIAVIAIGCWPTRRPPR